MKVGIVGGKLQGLEAAYLAKKAGWEVILIDRYPDVPACKIADVFYRLDVSDEKKFLQVINQIDLVIPALENKNALETITRLTSRSGVSCAFDLNAFNITSSKVDSNRLFEKIGVPMPKLWPDGRFPLVVKPSDASGSEGVRKVRNKEEMNNLVGADFDREDWVIQEFVEGPSYSIEVIGCSGNYQVFQITELEMDENYDCKRVLAPSALPAGLEREFEGIALSLAREIRLSGIMDVEVILHEGKLKVLEIDARLPSQTPAVVYHSTGVNMIKMLAGCFGYNKQQQMVMKAPGRGVVYEHIRVSPEGIKIWGEHVMADASYLEIKADFFGADEAITNYQPGKECWVATLINTGENLQKAREKRNLVLNNICRETGHFGWVDLCPPREV